MILHEGVSPSFRWIALLALIVSAIAAVGLFASDGVLAPLLVAGAVCGAAGSLFLLSRPQLAFWLALFFRLLHWGEPETAVPILWQEAANGTFAIALVGWFLPVAFRRRPIYWEPVCIIASGYIAWLCLALLWTPDIGVGLEQIRRFTAGTLLVFLCSQHVRSLSAVDGLMRTMAIMGWILAIYGFVSMPLVAYQLGERLSMPGINSNEIGPTLLQMLPGVIWPVLRNTGAARRNRLFLCVAYIAGAVVLTLLSGSRGGAFSLGVGLVCLCLWKPIRRWAPLGLVLLPLLIAVTPSLFETLGNRFEEEGNVLGKREVLAVAALKLIQEHPLTGVGVGNGPHELPRVMDWTLTERASMPAHNPILAVGIDSGVPGILLYVSAIITAAWRFARHRGRWRNGPMAAYFPIISSCAAGYSLAWIKGGGMEYDPTFFLMLALFVIPSQLSPEAQSTEMHAPSAPDSQAAARGDVRGLPRDGGRAPPETTT